MGIKRIFTIVPGLLLVVAGCAPSEEAVTLDPIAEAYVRLALDVGRHDPNYVDAYYGPAVWREEAEAGEPVALPLLLERAGELLARIAATQASPRRDFLLKQLLAVDGYLRRETGETMTLSEEARALYDFEAPVRSVEELEAARSRIEALVPGDGDLPGRVRTFRDRFHVPVERLPQVVDAILAEAKRRTAEHVDLPDGERFDTAYVSDKPWNAYNWYQGGLRSLIEFNTDLPSELGPLLTTVPHESYPGHHTYNCLLEQKLAVERGWSEITIYPLFSPQSLIAEGTANAGVDVIMSADERLAFMRDTLAAIAGLEGLDFERYAELLAALEPTKYARGEGARMLLDEGRPDEEVVTFLVRYGLMSEERARKSVDFIRTYRAYVFNYTAGEDLVLAYIGDGPERAERFFGLLDRPVTPSELSGPTP
jgi:hypothetical protein